MFCSNCGTCNTLDSKFCAKCGNALAGGTNQESPISNLTPDMPAVNPNVNVEPVQNTTNSSVNVEPQVQMSANAQAAVKTSFVGFFMAMLAVVLKPFTAFKEHMGKFENIKNSAILSVLVAGCATIVNLLTSMIGSIFVKKFDWTTGKYTTSLVFENLGNIDYLSVIFKNFLIYAVAIFGVAALFYVAGLIAKKQVKYPRLVGIAALSFVPVVVCGLVVSPIVGLVWSLLSLPVTLIGAAYTIILLYEGMNAELMLEGNMKYYVNLACFSILAIAGYYLVIVLILGSLASGLGDVLGSLG